MSTADGHETEPPGRFRDPRPIAPGSPAEHDAQLAKGRNYLDRLRVHHVDLVTRFLKTGEGIYTIDVFLAAMMTRSYSLVDGFIAAFDTWNPIVAAPLLRMQLDSLVRAAYMATAPRSDDVAEYVIKGGEFRSMKDKDGKALSDSRLITLASGMHPWVRDVYNATSGWVHFSPEHVRAAWQVNDKQDGSFSLSGAIPLRSEQIGLDPMAELLAAMIKATQELFGHVEIWESRKGLPVGEIRELALEKDPPSASNEPS